MLLHGGDVYTYAQTHGGQMPLDFSANINPFGTPPAVMQAMQTALTQCMHYPDPLCRDLRQAIAIAQQIEPAQIFCGNGAAEVLFRLGAVLKPRRALLTAPTFAEYALSLPNCQLCYHTLRAQEDFAVTERILQDITPDLDAIYLCNPNNPTGRTIAPALMRQIIARCQTLDIWLVVDECFCDFLVDMDAHVLTSVGFSKLIQLRAFTKMYAVAGIRLGYCIARDLQLIDALYRAGQPWNVSVVAQACGVAAAAESEFARKTAYQIAAERQWLKQGLEALSIKAFAGEANFLLFYSDQAALSEKTAQQGVLLRDCANYRGLTAGYYRTAVRERQDNMKLLEVLARVQK